MKGPDYWLWYGIGIFPKDVLLINLGANNLSGEIPESFGDLVQLGSIHLGYNNLYGKIPTSLVNCKKLHSLQLYQNLLSGSIPVCFFFFFQKKCNSSLMNLGWIWNTAFS